MWVIVEWLMRRPLMLAFVGIVALIALIAWFAAPISWRDGEGSIVSEEGIDDPSSVRGLLHGLLRNLRFWS